MGEGNLLPKAVAPVADLEKQLAARPAKGVFQSLPLAVREREVFGWICEGRSNLEIATILGISVHTVHKHVEHLFAKLGVENRLQAQRLGWEMRTKSNPAV